MKDKPSEESSPPDKSAVNTTQRKAYQRPVLHLYGAVHLLTRGASAGAGDGASAMQPAASDRSVKENVARVGQHPLGIGLYLFDYRPRYRERYGYGRQFGVMADEVETVMPEAVSVHPDGYKMVDYALLGIAKSIR